jgi:hypothetical protein
LEYQGKGDETLELRFEINDIERARLVPQIKF